MVVVVVVEVVVVVMVVMVVVVVAVAEMAAVVEVIGGDFNCRSGCCGSDGVDVGDGSGSHSGRGSDVPVYYGCCTKVVIVIVMLIAVGQWRWQCKQ